MVFDAPRPPEKRGHDFSENPLSTSVQVDYKAGKLDRAAVQMLFDGKMDESYIERGFSFYDKEAKARVGIPKFTAWVLGVYYGSFSNGQGKGDIRYMSNLVSDTRTDIVQSSYFMDSKRQTLAIGKYTTDIAPVFERMGRNSSYTRVLVAWVPEIKSLCQFHLNATSEAGILKAIAKARGLDEWHRDVNFFGLSDLQNECWVFQFSGAFEPVVFSARDAKRVPPTVPATKSSPSLYFQPVIEGGVYRSDNAEQGPRVAKIHEMWQGLSDYMASEQAFLRGLVDKVSGEAEQPAPSQAAAAVSVISRQEPADFTLPQHEVAANYENATADLDGLPF